MFSKFFKHQPVAANTEEKVHLNVQSDLESSENNMVLRTEDLVKKYRQRTVACVLYPGVVLLCCRYTSCGCMGIGESISESQT